MHQAINITEEDFAHAENILLPKGTNFDEERRIFIRNLDTIDLQAVPGSGKTTVLLAKLLILEKKLPFDDGSGILVISHTNSAIDEIKYKIQKHCPILFSYPNFIGTIQSFVDEFLAIPFYINQFKKKPVRIDSEIFEEVAKQSYDNLPNSKAKVWLMNQFDPEGFFKNLRFDADFNLLKGMNGEICLRSETNSPTYKILKSIKFNILKSGFLNYDDAYFLAELYLKHFPVIVHIIQKRFSFVFIDEMQDMDSHQYNLIEKVFFGLENNLSVIQRIGDKNQAIFNSVKVSDHWIDRPVVLRLSGSQRLSEQIAKVVTKFALYCENAFTINGLNPAKIKPHILVYQNNSIGNVIPYFAILVNQFRESGQLFDFGRFPIKAIAWNTEWKEQADKDNINKLRLSDFHKTYTKNEQRSKTDFSNLKSYLVFYDKQKQTLESIRKNILNAILKVLRYETIYYDTDKTFTKKKLLEYLKDTNFVEYEKLKLNLYTWSIGIVRGNINDVCNQIRNYIPNLLSQFTVLGIFNSTEFIYNDDINEPFPNPANQDEQRNKYKTKHFDIDVESVHAVKGQTHCATLYLESFYDGNYESLTLYNSFLNQNTTQTIVGLKTEIEDLKTQIAALAGERGTKTRETKIRSYEAKINLLSQSTKMFYVGLSRPTNFLCIAIHKDRFDKLLSGINTEEWEIIGVPT